MLRLFTMNSNLIPNSSCLLMPSALLNFIPPKIGVKSEASLLAISPLLQALIIVSPCTVASTDIPSYFNEAMMVISFGFTIPFLICGFRKSLSNTITLVSSNTPADLASKLVTNLHLSNVPHKSYL